MDSQVTLIPDGEETIKVLEKKRKELCFSATITATDRAGVMKLHDLIFSQVDKSNKVKKRAQRTLRTIFNHSRELFVLCGLATSFTFISNQTRTDTSVSRVLA